MNDFSLLEEYFLPPASGDMTAAIEEKLQKFGVCLLGSGTYSVRGITMPEGTTLRGMGRCSRILLDPAVQEGFAVSMGSFCCVKDLQVVGAQGEIELPEQPGTRHGILYKGTATRKNWQGPGLKLNSIVQACHVSGFTGGGITCSDTGYYLRAAISASDCHITNCGAGINVAYLSDYHTFTNMICDENLYGCINNGGNNMFSNCSFNGNVRTGFLIDNAHGQSPNNSHGSCVCCTFNHNGNNQGIAIEIYGAQSGFVFSACQIFFSKIVVERSLGIHFSDMNLGREVDILIRGEGSTLFRGCMFQPAPTHVEIDEAATVVWQDCYLRNGTPLPFPKGEENG